MDWFYVTQQRDKWSALVGRVMNLQVPEKLSLYRLLGLQDFEAPRMVVRLLALRTSRLYPPPPGVIAGTHFS